MTPDSPTDGTPAPLLCRYGPAVADTPTVPGLDLFVVDTLDPIEALRAAATAHPGRDVLLCAGSARLPPACWPRLAAAARAAPFADVLSPLSNTCAALDPRAPQSAHDDDTVDALCWAYSDRTVLPLAVWLPALSLWRAHALRALPSRAGELAPGLQGGLLDHLYVAAGSDHIACADVPACQVLRDRLAKAGDARLPRYGLDGRATVLHILHGWGGGAQRFVEDLIAGDAQRHHLVLVARADAGGDHAGSRVCLHAALDQAPLRSFALAVPIAVTATAHDAWRDALQRIVADFGVGAVLVSSLIGHSLDALRTGLPTAVVCHDYHPLWPRLHADFGDASRDFSPAAIPGALDRALGPPDFAETRPSAWQALRAAYVQALAECDALLITPTRVVQDNLRRIEPALASRRWMCIEHALAPFPAPLPDIAPPAARRGLRLVVPGRLRGGKGEDLIAALLPQLPGDVELVLLGGGAAAMRFFGRRHVHVVLDYSRDELPARLAELAPDAALLPSTVAETYSYLLSELWSLGVPVIATALGSFAERIVPEVNGLLVAPDAEALAALLERLRDDRRPLQRLRSAPRPSLPTPTSVAAAYASALPAPARSAAAPRVQRDPRGALDAIALARRDRELAQAHSELRAQQRELERRGEWARFQERLARERTAWAKDLDRRRTELEHEVEARGAWARSLIVEVEYLTELVASEQARLQAELERERGVLMAQRDALQDERDRMLASSSWRLTAPLRWMRRKARALTTRAAFQAKRIGAVQHRLLRSLRSRGLGGTLRRIREEFRPPQPLAALVLPPLDASAPLPTLPCADLPQASIVVPVYNHFHHTRTCLQALATCGDATPFEVIVVDDHSSDETESLLRALPGLRYLRNAQNLGFIGACNAGAAAARGEVLVFLNNDTAVQPGWLDALLRTFGQQRDVGLVGSKLVYPDGRLQEAGGIVFSDGSGWNYGRFDDPADPRYNFVREVDYCSGAAIAIPRPLFERFGGFDPHYCPAYYEDTDLAMKVRSAGLRVLYQPASVVVHFEGVSSGTDTSGSGTKRFQVLNQSKFAARWSEALATHPAPGTDIARARRHRARREVLIIDATTPQADHDSGSLRLVNTMRVMHEEGCALTFFADNRAWVERYTAELQQLGVEVLWHPWLDDPVRWFAENGRRFAMVFISRHYVASSYVGLVRLHAPQARLVFDTVDLHYLREQREADLSGSPEQAHAADVTRTRELALIRSADISLVVSPVEQELLRHEAPGARVEVLSNVHEVFGRRRGFGERRGLLFMGGYQHPPNVDAVLWFVREIFPRVRAALPEVEFHLVGSKAPDAVRALGEIEGVRFHGFVADIEPLLDGCRLAVAPLRYGAGVKGKVNMSMSYGQPVVATTMAVEGMYAEAGRDVLVADQPEDFASAVVRAYCDEELWTALSDHGLDNVRRHFSFEAARASVRRLFE